MPRPFVIFGLPRSRTTWLSHFLSYGEARVGHDIAVHCRRAQDFLDCYSRGMTGTCETGAVIGWPWLVQQMPDVRIVLVRRPLPEVVAELASFGMIAPPGELEEREAELDRLAQMPGVESIGFAELRDPHVCQWLFELLLDRPIDWVWWKALDRTVIQPDMQQAADHLFANYEALQLLELEIRELVSKAEPVFGSVTAPSVTYAWEHWDEFWPWAEPLLAAEHAEYLRVFQLNPLEPDSDAFSAACSAGVLRIAVARLRGKAIGYFFLSLGLDSESLHVIQATQGPWYVLPDVGPRVGLKLWNMARDEAARLGAHEMNLHSPVHGRGARLAQFFIAKGATPVNNTFKLGLRPKD